MEANGVQARLGQLERSAGDREAEADRLWQSIARLDREHGVLQATMQAEEKRTREVLSGLDRRFEGVEGKLDKFIGRTGIMIGALVATTTSVVALVVQQLS